jgi:hypothetical protein
MKMEKVRVLGCDPSLRNTGLAILTYDTEKREFDPPKDCQVLINPLKYKGTEAILNMLDMIKEVAEYYSEKCDYVLVESPPVMFSKTFALGTISMIAHVSGGATALLGIEKAHLFRPNEWNKGRKKDQTHARTIATLGNPDNWHYAKRLKSEKSLEHILDAVSMARWWIENNFIFEE